MITEIPKQADWIVRLFRVSSMSLVKVEPLHRSFSIAIRHPLFDVLVYVVFYIIADAGPFVLVYVGADVGVYIVLYVVLLTIMQGGVFRGTRVPLDQIHPALPHRYTPSALSSVCSSAAAFPSQPVSRFSAAPAGWHAR